MSNKGTLNIENKLLAKKLKCTERSIQNNKQDLRDEGWIKYKTGTIYINPSVIWKGSAKEREKAEIIYNGIDGTRKKADPNDRE